MVIKVYISSISGNMEMKKQQDSVLQMLQTHKVDFEKVDITDPTNEQEKMFMRENSLPREGRTIPLPPQIFNESEYCGDFDGLYDANECEEVLQFLKLEEAKPVSKAAVTLSEQVQKENQGFEYEQQSAIADVTDKKVSRVTLGMLTSKHGDENDNVKHDSDDKSSGEEGEPATTGASAVAEFAYERLTEGAEADTPPDVEPRVVRKSEYRKSKDVHDYENVSLTPEISVENKDFEQKCGDVEKADDSLSLNDSIEENNEKHGDGDGEKLEDDAEQ